MRADPFQPIRLKQPNAHQADLRPPAARPGGPRRAGLAFQPKHARQADLRPPTAHAGGRPPGARGLPSNPWAGGGAQPQRAGKDGDDDEYADSASECDNEDDEDDGEEGDDDDDAGNGDDEARG